MSVERDRTGNGWVARWRERGRQRSRKFLLKGAADAFELEIKHQQTRPAKTRLFLPGFRVSTATGIRTRVSARETANPRPSTSVNVARLQGNRDWR
jgi:hypothetical protein